MSEFSKPNRNHNLRGAGGAFVSRPEMACVPCLYRCGFGLKKIGRILGCNYSALSRKVKKLGPERRNLSQSNRVAALRKVMARPHNGARYQRKKVMEYTPSKMAADWKAEWKGVVDCYWIKDRDWTLPCNREKLAKAFRDRMKSDLLFSIKHAARQSISNGIRKQLTWVTFKRKERTHELIGCSYRFLKQYLEQRFKPGMSWANKGRGGWHIDHIIPVSSFDLRKKSERLKAFHYTNLQPLWESENIRKSDKVMQQQCFL